MAPLQYSLSSACKMEVRQIRRAGPDRAQHPAHLPDLLRFARGADVDSTEETRKELVDNCFDGAGDVLE